MDTNQTTPQGMPSSQKSLLILTWIIVGILTLPPIFLDLAGIELPVSPLGTTWISWLRIGLLALLWIGSWVWPMLKPLGGFALAFLAFFVANTFLEPFVFERETWTNWINNVSFGVWIVADHIQRRLMPIVLMALTLVGSGIGFKELYLVRGNPKAPASPTRLLQGNRTLPWNKVVWGWLPYYVVIITVFLAIQARPQLSQIARVLIFLPGIIIGAVFNAFAEEFIFRSMVLARLKTALGANSAIWIAAGLFGLMHYFGWPHGPIGSLLAAYLGWISAKSMVETGTITWALLIHTIGDFVIFAFLAMNV